MYPVDMRISFWIRMTASMTKATGLRASPRKALLAGFLSVWLKKCVAPSPSHDGILSWVLFPAIQLAHGKPLGLLPNMVCCIQRGLWALTEGFCRPSATKRGKGQVVPRDGSCPRLEMPYTYLMAWFAFHCPAIIQPGEEPPEVYILRIFAALRSHSGCGLT